MNPIMKFVEPGECLIVNVAGCGDEIVTFVQVYSDDLLIVNHKGAAALMPTEYVRVPPFVVEKYSAKLEREIKMSEHAKNVETRRDQLEAAQLRAKLNLVRTIVENAELKAEIVSFKAAEQAISDFNQFVTRELNMLTGVSQ